MTQIINQFNYKTSNNDNTYKRLSQCSLMELARSSIIFYLTCILPRLRVRGVLGFLSRQLSEHPDKTMPILANFQPATGLPSVKLTCDACV